MTSGLGSSSLQSVLDVLVAERQQLVESGRWHSGDRTLLEAMRVNRDEVKLCRALAWLLNPEGHHRLGDAVLRSLVDVLGIEYAMSGTVDVDLEVVRFPPSDPTRASRADIVVSSATQRLVIEAKVYAGEQPDQCARLVEAWGHEPSAVFVFLTLDAHRPFTAGGSAERWICVSWFEVGEVILRAARQRDDDTTGGATSLGLSLLETSRGDSMTDQTDFFLANYRQIRSLASAAGGAAQSLVDRMCVAFDEVLEDAAIDGWGPYRSGPDAKWARYGMCCETGELAGVIAGFGWTRNSLLSLSGADVGEAWPYLGILVPNDLVDHDRVAVRAREVLKPLIDTFALDHHERSWTAFTYTPAPGEVESVDGYVQGLAEQLRRFLELLAQT